MFSTAVAAYRTSSNALPTISVPLVNVQHVPTVQTQKRAPVPTAIVATSIQEALAEDTVQTSMRRTTALTLMPRSTLFSHNLALSWRATGLSIHRVDVGGWHAAFHTSAAAAIQSNPVVTFHPLAAPITHISHTCLAGLGSVHQAQASSPMACTTATAANGMRMTRLAFSVRLMAIMAAA